MGAGRKTVTIAVPEKSERGWSSNGSVSARNLRKADLGGIIFGCQHSTMKECLENNLFGLPASHISYVKNASPGMPLFLFNYNDRRLHGVFEAASSGQLHIDSHAWTHSGTALTLFPAQVRVRLRNRCRPLVEDAFSPIIADNYYKSHHFWFELDHDQTAKLLSLFELSPLPPRPPPISQPRGAPAQSSWREIISSQPQGAPAQNSWREKASPQPQGECSYVPAKKPQGECSYAPAKKPQIQSSYASAKNSWREQTCPQPQGEPAKSSSWSSLFKTSTPSEDQVSNTSDFQMPDVCDEAKDENNVKDIQTLINQLLEENEKLKGSELEHSLKICSLEDKLVKTQVENQDLRKQYEVSPRIEEAYHTPPFPQQQSDENLLIIGGYDGCRLLSDFSWYSLSRDLVQPLKPLTIVRSNTSVAMLNSELYIFGGANANSWYDTVESYNFTRKTWVGQPSLNQKRGSLAGISVSNKLYAIGGGDGTDCFAEVEMFDAAYGRWIFTKSMQHKRFTPAVGSMNGVIYAVGGYDGVKYLRSVERFDPREPRWTELNDMISARGCHSIATYNEKLYALGGFDGQQYVSSVEIFDPRACSWMVGEPMKYRRVYSAAVVTGGKIYTMGGLSDNTTLDSIECYSEGYGWTTTNLKALGKRSAFSAVVL